MDFELSEPHRMLADAVYDFMVKEIEPLAQQIDREDKLPDWIWGKLGELGWLGITVPEKYGGSGFDLLAQCICLEQMSRICPALSLSCQAHSNLCCDNLYRNGTEEQRQKYLPVLCRGEKLGALAITEPNAGSDAVGMQMRARKEGRHYILNGTKTFITNGTVAGTLIVYAKTAPEKAAKGITAFIVEPGFEGSFTSKEIEKMGDRGSPTGELVFDDYRVPQENILGEENQGIKVLMEGLDTERVAGAGWTLGMADRALELSLRYAKERVQFGRPIAEFQLIQEKLVDMYSGIVKAKSEAQAETFKTFVEGLKTETVKALGTNYKQELAFAAKSRDRFCSPELVEKLNESGLSNDKDVVKLFITMGKAISEDKPPEGPLSGGEPKTPGEILFPSAGKK